MKALSVTELTSQIKKQLEGAFAFVSVEGEVSNLKLQSSGHLYFTLKDSQAQLSAVLFKGQSRNLSRMPKEGDKVVLQGELTVYAPRGGYQLIVKEVQFVGTGELLLKLHELKANLERKGRFDIALKKPLPKFPKTIGVVTSPTGAVIQDILHILKRRFSGFHLILSPVKVQGDGAAEEIAKAIDDFNRYSLADVLIVGRGGGSLEDLWAFNEEIVVEAIFRSRIPIISAVGHETDFSLSDFAADVRAPTPSAAAEIVLAEKALQLKFLEDAQLRLSRQLSTLVKSCRRRMQTLSKNPYLSSPYMLLAQRMQKLDDIKQNIDASIVSSLQEKKMQVLSIQRQAHALKPSSQLKNLKQNLLAIEKSLSTAVIQKVLVKRKQLSSLSANKRTQMHLASNLSAKAQKFSQLVSHLQALNPKNILTKGYCILFSENNRSVILSSKELNVEQNISILMHDGRIRAKVEQTS